MQGITPFLWFDKEAEEAARFYASIFKNSSVGTIMRYGASGPGPDGSVMTATFTLDGQEFIGLNGGPHFPFTHAVSFFVKCDTQAEVDYYWEKLGAGGEYEQCGWLKDRYGVSWQIVPVALLAMLADPDREKARRTMDALMQMRKLDIDALQRAYAGD